MGLLSSDKQKGYAKAYKTELAAERKRKLFAEAKAEARADARTLEERGKEGVGIVGRGARKIYKNVDPKVTIRKDAYGRLKKLGRR